MVPDDRSAAQVQASPAAVTRMLQLLTDGEFLDKHSEVLRGRFVTCNQPLDSFATIEMELTRGGNGIFQGQVLAFYSPKRVFVCSV